MPELARRREAVETVHDIVSAMRAMAAGRIQGAQRALQSARRYEDLVLRSMALILAEAAATGEASIGPALGGQRRIGLLVLTPEQALCGQLAQEALAYASRRQAELAPPAEVHLLVMGHRGLRRLAAGGVTPDAGVPGATSVRGLRDLVKQLAAIVGERYAAGELDALYVVYNRYRSVSEQAPEEELVLPPDYRRLQRALRPDGEQSTTAYVSHYLTPGALLAGLVREYAFIVLYRLAAEAFASEQASRLMATDAATRSTGHMLDQLQALEHRERQAGVTRQVLELVTARLSAHRV